MTESRELALKAARILDEKGANHIVVLDVGHLTSITDYFVIANGTSTTHVAALADEVEFQLAKNCSEKPSHIEGSDSKRWILLDYSNVIVNVFTPDTRDFYGLEHQWADGEEVDISAELLAAEQAAKAEMQ
mgnify:CR=1 FL=1